MFFTSRLSKAFLRRILVLSDAMGSLWTEHVRRLPMLDCLPASGPTQHSVSVPSPTFRIPQVRNLRGASCTDPNSLAKGYHLDPTCSSSRRLPNIPCPNHILVFSRGVCWDTASLLVSCGEASIGSWTYRTSLGNRCTSTHPRDSSRCTLMSLSLIHI